MSYFFEVWTFKNIRCKYEDINSTEIEYAINNKEMDQNKGNMESKATTKETQFCLSHLPSSSHHITIDDEKPCCSKKDISLESTSVLEQSIDTTSSASQSKATIQPNPQVLPSTSTFDFNVPVMACAVDPPDGISESTNTVLKREFTEDLQPEEPLAKKCKDCDINESSLLKMTEKVKKMYESSHELERQISVLTEKQKRLCEVLMAVFTRGDSTQETTQENDD